MKEKKRLPTAEPRGASLVQERRLSPRSLRPVRLELDSELQPQLEPEPEPEPTPLPCVSPDSELPKPYSGPFTPGRHFLRYVRLLLAHVVLTLALGTLASHRGTMFSGQFPYSQPRLESSVDAPPVPSDVLAWALSRVGFLGSESSNRSLHLPSCCLSC